MAFLRRLFRIDERMAEKWMWTTPPLELIGEKREEMSARLREIYGKEGHAMEEHWLHVWIGEYDKAIAAIKESE